MSGSGDQESPSPRLSRRDFLRMVGVVGAGAAVSAAAGGAVGNAVGELAFPPPALTAEKFAIQTVEEMEVIGADTPLTRADLIEWERSRLPFKDKKDPLVRSTEILIGSDAWKKTCPDGETIAQFLRRHVDRMNDILARSRPELGISDMRMTARLVILEEKDLQGLSDDERQMFPPEDVYGRWAIDVHYEPEKSDFYHHGFDDGILHEIGHHSLYLVPHLFEYFLRGDNWRERLTLRGDLATVQKQNIRLWRENEMKAQFATWMLLHTSDREGVEHPLAEAEELVIRRFALSGQFANVAEAARDNALAGVIFSQDLALEYRVTSPFPHEPKLYTARCASWEKGDMLRWVFSGPPQPLQVEGDEIMIPKELLETSQPLFPSSLNPKFAPKAFLLVYGEPGSEFILGFTSWDLARWHWRKQLEEGEQNIGSLGKRYVVRLDAQDFDPPFQETA